LARGLREPHRYSQPCVTAFKKEIKGLVLTRKAFTIVDPAPHEKYVPLMEIFICKFRLDQNGYVHKLICRVVFRGDFHKPDTAIDSWNPHADYVNLKIFLGITRYDLRHPKLMLFPRFPKSINFWDTNNKPPCTSFMPIEYI
jgi:hypothetical protein